MRFKKLHPDAITPTRGTPLSAGLDLYATERHVIRPGQNKKVGTGIAFEIPEGYVGLVSVRSSIGDAGICLANDLGTIDADYRGEIMLNLHNRWYPLSNSYVIAPGQRIGQMVVVPAPLFELEEVDELSETTRGTGGFGSTGK